MTIALNEHLDIGLAKLSLKGVYGPDEIDDAADELLRKGYIKRCRLHENCVWLARGASAGRR